VRSWGDLDREASRTDEEPRTGGRRDEDDEDRRSPRSERRSRPEEDRRPRAAAPEDDGVPADPVLSRTLHDDLHDFLFSGLKRALEERIQAHDFIDLLRAVDVRSVVEELTRRGDQLPRQLQKVFRRHTEWDPRLDEAELGDEAARLLEPLERRFQAVEEALEAMHKGATIPDEDGALFLADVRTALGAEGAARKLSYPRAPGLLSMVGVPLEGAFRPPTREASPNQPKKLLGAYHGALRNALEACDQAWMALFDRIGELVRAAGGPRLLGSGPIWGKSQELTRLKERAQALLAEGEPRKALKVVEQARAQEPRDASLVVLGLRIALASRQKADCETYVGLLESEFPDDAEGVAARVEFLGERGDPKLLLPLLEKGLSLDPKHRAMRELLLRTRFKQGEYAKVLELLTSFLADHPRESEFLLLRARAHGFLDQEARALEALREYTSATDLNQDALDRLRKDEAFDCLAANEDFDRLLKSSLDLLALADSIFSSDNKTFYFPDEIPAKKLKNAQSSWLELGEDEELVFLIDTTFLGRCTDGVACTNERLIWKDMGCDPEDLALEKLRPDKLRTAEGKVFFGRRSLSLSGQPHLLSPLHQFLLAVARANV
jgi:tetratricopeptide (TPR) repeat protein